MKDNNKSDEDMKKIVEKANKVGSKRAATIEVILSFYFID